MTAAACNTPLLCVLSEIKTLFYIVYYALLIVFLSKIKLTFYILYS
jgi:hypothetical protein